jgi:lipopolysaccharide export system permease protein
MNILTKYYLKEFFRFFVILLFSFTAVAVIAEFFDKSPEFYRHNTETTLILEYLLLQAPRVLVYALPFASLFSVLLTIGIASKWRETSVILASGYSLKKTFSVFLVLGAIFSVAALLFGETIVPAATRKAVETRKVKILKEPRRIVQGGQALWLKGLDGSLIRIAGFIEDEDRILKTSIFQFGPSFTLIKRIEADEARWINGAWHMKGITVFDFTNNSRQKLDSYISRSLEEPKIFREDMKKPEEMNFVELYSYYSRLERAGFKNLKYLVRLYEKISYPVVNFVMMLFGVSLALNTRWGGGVRAAGIGVIVSVLYWLLYSLSISMGNTGIMKPWAAPWISPILFCMAGILLYRRIKE